MNLSSEEKTMAMLCHLLILPTGFIAPLVIWLMKKDESEYVNRHGKEALNFAFTMTIAYAASWVLLFVLIGALLMLVLGAATLVFAIMGGIKAYEGGEWKYPFTIPFLK